MSDDLTRRIADEILHRIVAPEEGDIVPVVTAENAQEIAAEAARAIAALIAEREAAARKEGCAWAEAIERWFIEWEMLPDWSAADPWAELHRMICWEQQVALDPAVSEDARKLIAEERARVFEEAAEWHDERAERTRRTLERGMSLAMRDTLDTVAYHHEQSAAAIRALAKKEAPEPKPDNLGHVTRIVDAATHDERCDRCGATDARGDDRLTQPCPNAKETGQ